jgi:GntR family transcriptional regulator, rspAB operon transcriptional repressor
MGLHGEEAEMGMLAGEIATDGKASDRAYGMLRQMIVSMKLEPGAAIDEKRMSHLVELGRTPVREALLRLADQKLVEIMPRRGTFVAPIRLHELRAVEELRWHLETLTVRWAAQRIEPDELEALRRLVDDAAAGAFEGVPDWDVEVDRSFHLLVARSAKNPFLAEELARLYDHSVRLLYATRITMAPMIEELSDYRALIEALEARSSDEAEMAMQRHLRASRQQVASGFESALAPERG